MHCREIVVVPLSLCSIGDHYNHSANDSLNRLPNKCPPHSPVPVAVIMSTELDSLLTCHIVHDHVQVVLVLEGKVQLYDPVRVSMRHNVALLPEARRVRALDHLALGQPLHRIHLPVALVPHQLHLAERTAANHFDQTEVGRTEQQPLNVLGDGAIYNWM